MPLATCVRAFFIAYIISNAFSGFVIDKLGTRLGYALCMGFWTMAGLIHAFAVTPLQFGICRFLLGIGETGNWPAAVRMTSEWFPPHERSTASGIFNSGAALGAIIVPPFVGYGLICNCGSPDSCLSVMGPLHKDEELHRYAVTMEEKQ